MFRRLLLSGAAFASLGVAPLWADEPQPAGDSSHITKGVITGIVVLLFAGLVLLVKSGGNSATDPVDQAIDGLGNFQI